jgi:Zn-dependent peptidase ImmA (M78 family)
MIDQRKRTVFEAMRLALEARQVFGFALSSTFCIFDFVERAGIEVRFLPLGTVEGFYRPSPDPIIVINSDRPFGRQAFTCAHEYGHHVFKDGASIETLNDDFYSGNSREFRTDVFAGILLMPKALVQNAFTTRGWQAETVTPVQLYSLASYMGVSYSAMSYHLCLGIGLISRQQMNRLLLTTPKSIKYELLGHATPNELIVVDTHWGNRPVDLHVDDIALLPIGTRVSGNCIRVSRIDDHAEVVEGVQPGVGQLSNPDFGLSVFVRVSKKSFVGRNRYRHFEEYDDESI